ncbi:Nitrogen permease regulator 2 [Dissophora globulifera]|uniref:Nitrogen permease regulator 2 n=1 Tax=Dissophora globulifera TaxID=979702 RepID=A0A9P6UY28_9FUNG|nr:Nitrogen permease regulator 2 [Dissophora globulifera]
MGFPRLLSIFYCTFHPIQGPKVLYEVPEGSILSKTSPLVDFDSISEYLIPKVELCSKLVTILTPTCKVIGFPINLEHKKFQRNALMFNLAFVFDKDAETSSYEPVVRKMARVLKALEKESEFLSRQTRLAMMGSGALTNPHTISSVPLVPINSHASTAVKAAGPTPVADVHTVGASSAPLETASATALSTDSTDKTSGSTSLSAISNALAAQELSSNGATQPASLPPALPGTVSTSQALPAPNSILSSTLMSSPPSLSSGTITSAITGPPSSSPFTQSKPVSTSSTAAAGISTNGAASAPSSQRGMTSLVSLLQQEHADGSGMQNLIEQLIEDLNSYCECQIPIDSANTINLKLFPTYPNPAPVYDYQVPISTVNLEALTDLSWDMTMQRIIGFINGVSSVKRIAQYADVETGLTRMCMQHLLYYGCIIMVDLFQFKNIYAVKLEMMRLTEDLALQHECVSYVTLPDMHAPSFAKIFSLYCSLQYGVVLQDWIEQNQISDFNIDASYQLGNV